MHKFYTIMLGVMLYSVSTLAQLSGPLSGSLGPGTYTVVGDISIPSSGSLTIQPGTTFLFDGSYGFDIYGKLYAIGTETDSIKFQRNLFYHTWYGLDFHLSLSDSSRLEYCVIEGSDCMGVECANSSPTFSNCTIRENDTGIC